MKLLELIIKMSNLTLGLRMKMGKSTTLGLSADEVKSIIKNSNGELSENSSLQDMKIYIFKTCKAQTSRMILEEKHIKIIEAIKNGKT